jgi:hypothetical protein
MACAVPVSALAVRFAVENVRGAFRGDAERVQRRTLRGIYRVPARTILPRVGWRVGWRGVVVVAIRNRLTVGGAECLVILGASSRLGRRGRLWPFGGNVSGRSVMAPMPLLGLAVVPPVRSFVVPV